MSLFTTIVSSSLSCQVIALLPNHFYMTWQLYQNIGRVFDLSGLLPSSNGECHDLPSVLEMDYGLLDSIPILTPTFDGFSFSVLFSSFERIIKLTLPLTPHSQISPSLEDFVSYFHGVRIFLGTDSKFLSDVPGSLSRSTPAHIISDPDPVYPSLTGARCVKFSAPEVVVWCKLRYDYVSDRMIALHDDGEVYTLDINIA